MLEYEDHNTYLISQFFILFNYKLSRVHRSEIFYFVSPLIICAKVFLGVMSIYISIFNKIKYFYVTLIVYFTSLLMNYQKNL